MAKTLSKALGTDIAGLAQLLRSKGRGKDTILAHINPQEAALLKRAGGSGDINPDTGLPEFYTEDGSFGDYGGSTQPDPSYFDTSSGSGSTQPDESFYTQAYYPDPEAQVGGYYGGGGSFPEQLQASAPAPTTDVEAQAGGYYGGQRMIPTNATELAKLQQPPGVLDEFTQQAKKALKDPTTVARLATTGGLGLMNALNARKASRQNEAATAEQKAIGQPYTETGQKLMAQAQAGNLTPQSQAALNAAKAQIAQSVASRGGVGQQQAANQVAQIYNNLLDNQYKYGLQVAQIGDNIAIGAIRTGMQMDRELQKATLGFYAALAPFAAGDKYGYLPQPTTATTRTPT